MTGFLRSIGFIADEPHHVPAVVASRSDGAAGPSSHADLRSDGRDSEPPSLRQARERVQSAELERDLALSALILLEARYAAQRPVWSAE